jgi:hypothetical protein
MGIIATFELQEILPKLPKVLPKTKTFLTLRGVDVNISKQRYVNFVQKGTTCSKCGLKGEFFGLERQEGRDVGVLNLYGINRRGEDVIISSTTDKRRGRTPIGQIFCNDCQHRHVSHSKSIYDKEIEY